MKILWLTFVAAVVVMFACILLVQTSFVQTFITRKVTESLSKNIFDADISIETVRFRPFNTLVLKNISVTDQMPAAQDTLASTTDTLFNAEYIIARFSLKSLAGSGSIGINSAEIRNGAFNLVVEDGLYTTNLTRMFRLLPPENKPEPEDREIFMIGNVRLEDFRFTMKNYSSKAARIPEGGINWNDMDITGINVSASDLRMKGKVMSGTCNSLSFREKSGYVCEKISGSTEVGNGRTIVRDFTLKDPWSRLHLDRYCMFYNSEDDFKDYVNKVRMEAEINEADISFETIAYFAPQLKGNRLRLVINGGGMTGPVEKMVFRDIDFAMPENLFRGKVSGSIAETTVTDRMKMDFSIDHIDFDTESLEKFITGWSGGKASGLDKFARGETFRLTGTAKGLLNAMNVDAEITSSAGNIGTALHISGLASPGSAMGFRGSIRTKDLRADRILKSVPVRECSISAGFSASFGKEIDATIDSLLIDRLNFNGYDYNSIAANGRIYDNMFEGKVICSDPNLNFLYQGIVALSPKTHNALYKFYANVGHADLNALNIDRRGKSEISFRTMANFKATASKELFGNIDVADIVMENSHGRYDIGSMSASSQSSDSRYGIQFDSSFAEAEFSGTGSFPEFIKDFSGLAFRRELPAMYPDENTHNSGKTYNVSFRTLNTIDLLSFVLPGLYIAEGTEIRTGIDGKGLLSGSLKSQRIAFREQYMKDVYCSFDNRDNAVSGELTSENISVASLTLKNNSFNIFLDDNHFGAGFTYENPGKNTNRGEIFTVGDVLRDEDGKVSYRLELLPSSLSFNSREWNVHPSEIIMTEDATTIRNLEFRSGNEAITAAGRISKNSSDTISVSMNRFDISILNPLLGPNLSLSGALSGHVSLFSPVKKKGMLVDFVCDSTSIAGEHIGDLSIRGRWDERFNRMNAGISNNISGKSTFDISGHYSPSPGLLYAKAVLDSMKLRCFQPFLADIFSEMDGSISGSISAEGPLNRLEIGSSGTRLNQAGLKIAYTNVRYIADGAFGIDSKGVYFNDISLNDRYGNTGSVRGKIGFDHFNDIYFDTFIDVDRIEAIDIGARQADGFYGHLFATGRINISGPVSSIMLTADATTAGAGQLHIPIASSANAGSGNLLKFKEPETFIEIDPYEEMMSRMKARETSAGEFGVKLKVNAGPEVEAFIEIDKESGNVLTGRGNGLIELDIRPNRDIFDIKGDYTITQGNYKFVVLGLASRDFSINDGSSIKFNGDIMESTLNIDASYRTKASISTLIADTTSVSNRRIVDCGIRITDNISNPRIGFSITIPDLDPVVKSRVESALSTEDKIQKQFLSLIISNSFLPDEQSGIVNNSNVLVSNVTEIMTNQLNNIFQKLDIPLDLGLNYQPTESGNDIFDVAVSTQLFNNRVIVNGNIGNRQYSNAGNSDVVGDIDIEIKLDRPGAFRLNLFSHSADQYTNYLDNSQRNGIGLTYQQEFDSFGQFFRNLFSGKKKREERKRLEAQARMDEEKIRIEMSAEDYEKQRKRNERKRKQLR